MFCFWENFHCCKWPNIEKQTSHLVTLVVENKNFTFYSLTLTVKRTYRLGPTLTNLVFFLTSA